jgi:hypothetical protein
MLLHELRAKDIVDEPTMQALLQLESTYLINAVIRGELLPKALLTRESMCSSIASMFTGCKIKPKHCLVFKVFVKKSINRRRRRHMVERQTELNVQQAQQKDLEEREREEAERLEREGRLEIGELRSSNEAITSPTRGLFGCVPGCTETPTKQR